jgi:hypothetical protein
MKRAFNLDNILNSAFPTTSHRWIPILLKMGAYARMATPALALALGRPTH